MKIGCDLLYVMSKYFEEEGLLEENYGGSDNFKLLQELKNFFRENDINTAKSEFVLKIQKKED